MLSDLHTRRHKADWEYVSSDKQSAVQRLAAATRGIVTPANAISIFGFLLVLWGVLLLTREKYSLGVLLLIIGRLADIADGYLAERTQTKSRLGEILDVVIDKFTIVIVLGALIIYFSVPAYVLAFVIAQSVLVSLAGLYVHFNSYDIHVSRLGKTAMALTWAVIVLFVVLEYTDNTVLSALAYGAFGAYIATGIASLQEYYDKIVAAGKKTNSK